MSDELKQSVKDAIKKAEKVVQKQKKAVDDATAAYKQASRTLNALLATLRQMGVATPAAGKSRGMEKKPLREVVIDILKRAREGDGESCLSPAQVHDIAQRQVACSKGAVAFNLQQLNREGLATRPERGKYKYELEAKKSPPKKTRKAPKRKPARKRRKKPAKK